MAERKKTDTIESPPTEAKNSLPVYDMSGKVVSHFELDPSFFDGSINKALLAQVARVYQANQHQGTAKAKTRGEVRGGGRKPWKQKGTGRARTGSIRGAQWRGGGIIFGPVPSDPSLKLNKKMRSRAMFEALKLKIQTEGVFLVNELNLSEVKTKTAAQFLKAMPTSGKTLVLTAERNENNLKSFRNLANVKIEDVRNLSPYDALFYNSLLIAQDAFKSTVAKLAPKKEVSK